ncbi:HPF/RaiA family ribosome-associated protein [Marimonas lutisalis]|uniref:HPF/RaiA family ribosome-associated protein n=1 Tax=Marimonas lutisalis TaxID=2545756 RepID=UPI0010FA4485|nr:HPF/RaiA family ribosome-associated protein [Marimonas lutisalis]
MQTEPIITFRNMETSAAVKELVGRRIDALEHLNDRIVGVEVILDAPQKRKVSGRMFRARVNLQVPGPDLSFERSVAQGSARDDLLLAVNRAFSAAEKALKKQKKQMGRVEVKQHPPVLHGEVTLIEAELGYGYMRADDGREVYFQRDSLTSEGDWEKIEKGTQMRFRERQGEKGPFATGVTLVE